MFEIWAVWLILAGVLFVIEMLTLTFYMLWFGIGALVASGVSLITPEGLVWQVLSGCAVILVLTVFTKPLTRRFRVSRGFVDAVDALVGKQGVVLERIREGQPGIVKVGNETWSAMADEELAPGDDVAVVSRGSAMLKVEKWKGEV